MGLGEKIWGNSIGANVVYGKDGTTLVPLKVNADGELVVNLEAATVNIGDVDIQSLPSGNLGQQHKAASLSIAPADDIADGTYLGDIKFGEALPDTTASDLAHIHAAAESIKTAVEGATPAGTAIIGKVGIDPDANEVSGAFTGIISEITGGIKDNGPQWTPVRTYTTSADMTTAAAITAAPASGQKIYADDILVSAAVAMEFSIQEETSNTVFASVFLPANGTAQITLRNGLKAAVADKKLMGKASAAGNVRVTCCYHSEA